MQFQAPVNLENVSKEELSEEELQELNQVTIDLFSDRINRFPRRV